MPLGPAALTNFWLTKATTLPLLDQVPAMDAALTEQVIVAVPAFTVTVSSSGKALLRPLMCTGFPLASLTVALYGRLRTLWLLMVTPLRLILQPLKVSAVIDSLAVPGLAGLVTTFAVKVDLVQVRVPRLFLKTTDLPFARLAFRTAPGLTAVPPTFPVVSTWTGAASAAVTGCLDSADRLRAVSRRPASAAAWPEVR